jgi:hypothetical protein
LAAAAAASSPGDERSSQPLLRFQLSADPTQPVAAVAEAMGAAEAAQQALLDSGPLAEEAQQNQLLQSILQTYSTLQRLYHKAMLQQLQQHEQLARTPAGLAYSLLCQVLGQQPQKQPGDSVSSRELLQLVGQVQGLPPLKANQPEPLLAEALVALLLKLPSLMRLTAIDCFVLPDVISVIAGCWGELVADPLDDVGISGLDGLSGAALSTIAAYMAREECAPAKPGMAQALLNICRPQGSPPVLDAQVQRAKPTSMGKQAEHVCCHREVQPQLAQLLDCWSAL